MPSTGKVCEGGVSLGSTRKNSLPPVHDGHDQSHCINSVWPKPWKFGSLHKSENQSASKTRSVTSCLEMMDRKSWWTHLCTTWRSKAYRLEAQICSRVRRIVLSPLPSALVPGGVVILQPTHILLDSFTWIKARWMKVGLGLFECKQGRISNRNRERLSGIEERTAQEPQQGSNNNGQKLWKMSFTWLRSKTISY